MYRAFITSGKIHASSSEAFSLHEKSRLGEKVNDRIEYSYLEALYLVAKKYMSVSDTKKQLSFETLLKKAMKDDKRTLVKFTLFKNLRDKGYIVKTALKFGADFRIYRKGVKPGEDHALWIAYAVRESESHSWHDFAAKNRVAHSTKKKLLIGIVDDENDVTFYEINWVKP